MKKQIISDSKGKKLLMFVTLLFAGLMFSAEVNAQSKPAASLAANGVLQLPSNVALAPAYEFSLSSFGFTTQDQATQYFSSKSYDSFFIRPNFSQGKAVLMLNTKSHPGWTVSEWNNLLNSQTTATPLLN
jgi:uncharacterized protein YfdQ (DUF2303 family)